MKVKTSIDIINPANGEVIDTVPIASQKKVELAGAIVRQAALQCRSLSRFQRSEILEKTAQLIALEKDQFAKPITKESGKTITQSVIHCVGQRMTLALV